ncbi:MAG: zinc ribbon domain-containing protein [Deltaproteobacteria bacterium]|nr:zinc ribbon domain-containing protein [Deltaproteobacteria bacterium]
MPLYEYCCSECAHQFEEIVSLGKEADVKCPKCGAGSPKRLMSAFASCTGSEGGVMSSKGSGCSPSSSPFS